MRDSAAHCEAKLHGFRRTQEGVVVSFVLHPQEVPQALALDPLGTRYMLALCAIGDDEKPIALLNSPAGNSQPQPDRKGFGNTDGNGPQPQRPPAGETKERQPWHTLPPQRQAGILCSDGGFQKYVHELTGWIADEQSAAVWLRQTLGIVTRKELETRPDLAAKLNEIRADFMEWAGRVPVAVR